MCTASSGVCAASSGVCTASSNMCTASSGVCAASSNMCTASSGVCAASSGVCTASSDVCTASSDVCTASSDVCTTIAVMHVCTTSSGNIAMGNRRCGLRNTEMLFTYLCMLWETDLHILWSSGVCLCVYVRMTTCVCGVNTDVVTFSFQYTDVIESNDTKTPVGQFEVLSCAHVHSYASVLEPFVLESISCS